MVAAPAPVARRTTRRPERRMGRAAGLLVRPQSRQGRSCEAVIRSHRHPRVAPLESRRGTGSARLRCQRAYGRTSAARGRDDEGVDVRSCNDVRYGGCVLTMAHQLNAGAASRCSCGNRSHVTAREPVRATNDARGVRFGRLPERRDPVVRASHERCCRRRARTTHAARRPFLLCARIYQRKSQALQDPASNRRSPAAPRK